LAAAYAARHLAALSKHLKSVGDGSRGECIHLARVAARRLRVAIKVFSPCFPTKPARRWRRQLRRLLRTLGDARDLDIQIAQLDEFLASTDDRRLQPGIERLGLRLRQQRDRRQDDLLAAVKRFRRSGAPDEMRQSLTRLGPGRIRSSADVRSRTVFAEGSRQILAALQTLLGHRDCLWNPRDVARHHAMRIAAKRLRYAMEAFAAAYPSKLKPQIDAARHLQTALGDLHDCDMWIERIDAFVREERKRTEEYFGHTRPFARLRPGLEHLLEQHRRKRDHLFAEAGRTWSRFGDQAVWEKLVQTLDQRLQQAEPPSSRSDAQDNTPPQTPNHGNDAGDNNKDTH
jgi:CHAD domain-containing protein